jgi:hypothetical protein
MGIILWEFFHGSSKQERSLGISVVDTRILENQRECEMIGLELQSSCNP